MIEISGKYYETAEDIVEAYYAFELNCPELVEAIETIAENKLEEEKFDHD